VLFFLNVACLTEKQQIPISGADPGFQVRGAQLKKLRRAEGGAKFFGVFRVKNHDFTPKNLIFSNFRGARRDPRRDPPGSAPEFYSLWLDPTGARTHDLPHSRRAR
jgi:hypothetical protein